MYVPPDLGFCPGSLASWPLTMSALSGANPGPNFQAERSPQKEKKPCLLAGQERTQKAPVDPEVTGYPEESCHFPDFSLNIICYVFLTGSSAQKAVVMNTAGLMGH